MEHRCMVGVGQGSSPGWYGGVEWGAFLRGISGAETISSSNRLDSKKLRDSVQA